MPDDPGQPDSTAPAFDSGSPPVAADPPPLDLTADVADPLATPPVPRGMAEQWLAEAEENQRNLPPPPRIWPTMLLSLCIIPAAILTAGIALVVAAAANGKLDLIENQTAFNHWLASFLHTPQGFLWATLPGQLVFLGSALIFAKLSPQPMRDRLGLRESRLGFAAYVLFPLATPTIAVLTGMLLGPLVENEASEQLKQMEEMITGPTGWHALLVISLVSLLPGFAEELVFRGYIQQRLAAAWGAIPAILFAGVFFAAAHLDFMHSLLVFPLGLWLGVVAWRTGTVWVAILCHAYYNLFQCLLARSGWADQAARSADSANVEMDPMAMAVFAVTMLAFAAALGLLMWDAVKPRKSPPLAA